MRSSCILLLSMFLMAGVACNRNERPDSPAATQVNSPKNELDPTVAKQVVTAAVQSIAEVEASIADHRGKIVVVDLWVLW